MGFMKLQGNQLGDTIVEVLVAIGIVSSVLVVAFATTNRNRASTQDAQERSQATQLAEGQMDGIRNAVSNGKTVPNGGCIDSTSGDPKPNTDPACTSSPNGAGTQPTYLKSISVNSNTYTVTITWDSVTASGQNNVTMYYRPPVAS